ncbi:hypothetical protein GcC1_123013 [Golovinomyces cichoracearum]|uniref:Uncharacterized protein n=1 Tax=Golovinomyces cichoracearum TaxID=62708 RepID=A0A420I6H3_9PEZI|nr:hypothetical protein GcC1_123013 [Golovinomyces cichoracearum]
MCPSYPESTWENGPDGIPLYHPTYNGDICINLHQQLGDTIFLDYNYLSRFNLAMSPDLTTFSAMATASNGYGHFVFSCSLNEPNGAISRFNSYNLR